MNLEKEEIFFWKDMKVQWIKKPWSRYYSIKVIPSGTIVVTSWKSFAKKSLIKYLESNRKWILKESLKFKGIREKFPQKSYRQGESFLFLGTEVTLEIDCGHSNKLKFERSSLVVKTSKDEISASEIKNKVQKLYKDSARLILQGRVNFYAKRLGLFPKKVSYRNQKTRWGSCSSEGNVSLNWRLVAAPLYVLDYVVIHELCHLQYQNHSHRFWSLVVKECPNFKEAQSWLNTQAYALDFLSPKSELFT